MALLYQNLDEILDEVGSKEKVFEQKIDASTGEIWEMTNSLLEKFLSGYTPVEYFDDESSTPYFFLFHTLLSAIDNAALHGNKRKKGTAVSVTIFGKNDSYLFRIEDQGPGFKFRERIDQFNEGDENYYTNGGCGFIAFDLYDHTVSYEGEGNIINIHIAQPIACS